MAQLFLIKQNRMGHSTESAQAELLISDLKKAHSLWTRGVGFLRQSEISKSEAMWLKPGNNIHTFFMRFSIDCIFLDSKMRVQKIYSDVKPFRFVGPVWKASSVIETAAGQCEEWKIKSGDQLYVVD